MQFEHFNTHFASSPSSSALDSNCMHANYSYAAYSCSYSRARIIIAYCHIKCFLRGQLTKTNNNNSTNNNENIYSVAKSAAHPPHRQLNNNYISIYISYLYFILHLPLFIYCLTNITPFSPPLPSPLWPLLLCPAPVNESLLCAHLHVK